MTTVAAMERAKAPAIFRYSSTARSYTAAIQGWSPDGFATRDATGMAALHCGVTPKSRCCASLYQRVAEGLSLDGVACLSGD